MSQLNVIIIKSEKKKRERLLSFVYVICTLFYGNKHGFANTNSVAVTKQFLVSAYPKETYHWQYLKYLNQTFNISHLLRHLLFQRFHFGDRKSPYIGPLLLIQVLPTNPLFEHFCFRFLTHIQNYLTKTEKAKLIVLFLHFGFLPICV